MAAYILVPQPIIIPLLFIAGRREQALKALVLGAYTISCLFSIVMDFEVAFGGMSVTNIAFKQVLNF